MVEILMEKMARLLPALPRVLPLPLLLLLLLPLSVSAHLEQGGTQEGHGSPSGGEGELRVGLEERLGQRIPLDLVFRDETGQRRRLGELVTGPTIIVPVYYRCTNVCNYLQSDLARVLPGIKKRPGADYRVLSVSIDETESPELAAGYQRQYLSAIKAPFPPDGWRFLTGDAANIRRLTDAAGFRFERRGEDFMHPVVCFIVARDGTIVRYLYGTSFLPKDVTLALIEAGEGRGGATIRKMVEYCFTFDQAQKGYRFNLLRVSATVVILCSGGFFTWLLLTGRRGKGTGREEK